MESIRHTRLDGFLLLVHSLRRREGGEEEEGGGGGVTEVSPTNVMKTRSNQKKIGCDCRFRVYTPTQSVELIALTCRGPEEVEEAAGVQSCVGIHRDQWKQDKKN